MTFGRGGKCVVTALSPCGYKTSDVTPSTADGKISIPLDGRNRAAYYDVRFPF